MTTDRRAALAACLVLVACGDPKADHGSWEPVASPKTTDFVDVSVTANTVWVLDSAGAVLQHDDTGWVDDGVVCSTGGGLNGGGQMPVALWAAADDDVWVVGGDICHFDGQAWAPFRDVFNVVTESFSACAPFRDVAGLSGNQVWILSDRCVLELVRNGPRIREKDVYFKVTTTANAPTTLCSNGCGSANDNFCDDGGAGSEFRVCALGTDCNDCGPRQSERSGPTLERVWASGPGDVWGITAGGVYNLVGNEWILRSDVDVNSAAAIWGLSDSNVFVADGTLLHHFDGSRWRTDSVNGLTVSAVWGPAEDDLWAVGSAALQNTRELSHFDGTTWSYATRQQDVVTAGFIGVVGAQLVKAASGSACCGLLAVDGSSADNVWAVGRDGIVIRYAPAASPLPR